MRIQWRRRPPPSSSSVTQDKMVRPGRPQLLELLPAPQGQRRGRSSVDRKPAGLQMPREVDAAKAETELGSRDLPIQIELPFLSYENAIDRKSTTAPPAGRA